VQPRCVSPSIGIRHAHFLSPYHQGSYTAQSRYARLPDQQTCLDCNPLQAPVFCSARSAQCAHRYLSLRYRRGSHATAVPSHGRTPPVEWPFRDSRSRCAASSQQACRGCPHSILGSSTKLAKRFHSSRLHHLTERSSLICAYNLYDALPLVRDVPTESASLRYGTGFCASFVPEQVHLCCRQRGRGTVAAHAHWLGTWWPLDSGFASSLHHDVRPCAGGRADVRSHHWVGILAHADYGPALLRLPLTCRSADLGLPRAPRQCSPGSFVSPAATGPGFAVADLSERTRPVTTVRCRRQQCSHAKERRGPSATPAGLEL